MPKENITRAISKSENQKGANFYSLRYEGFGPNNIALIIETLTDNKNRTAGNVRKNLQKFGGSLASDGSTTHFFDNFGVIQFSREEISDEKALDYAATLGAKDCFSYEDFHEIITIKEDFYRVKNESRKLIKKFDYSGIEWRPKNKVSLKKDDEKKLVNLLELLDEDDDIQKIFHNCNLI